MNSSGIPPTAQNDGMDKLCGNDVRRSLAVVRRNRTIAWLVITMMLTIAATEGLEYWLKFESEWLEFMMHMLWLVVILSPVFYCFWVRPLAREMAARDQSEREVRELSHRLLQSVEEERRMLARDLHDEFGQKLTALRLRMELFVANCRPQQEGARCPAGELLQATQLLIGELRRLTARLRPRALDELGLSGALEALVRETCNEQSALSVDYRFEAGRLPAEIEIVIYRLCQEALTNVVKHAQAKKVLLQVKQQPGRVEVVVRDDGIGFRTETSHDMGRIGLVGMRERVTAVGGSFRIDASGGGATLRVVIPWHDAGAANDQNHAG